jgi:hypothetical protein
MKVPFAVGFALGILAGRYRIVRRDLRLVPAWQPGSDELMETDVLARVRHEGELAEQERERKRARRGE